MEKECRLGNKPMHILKSLVLLMFVVALGSYASLNFEQAKFVDPSPATISVSGVGEVLTVPDIGRFSFSVHAEGENASIAQEVSGEKINAILAYLKKQGIEDKDVKTQNYRLNQKWRWEEEVCPFGSRCANGERIADGFEVSQLVSVKVLDVDNSGVIISGVGDLGATRISSLSFSIDDIEVIKDEAREKAIVNAQEKAVILAGQLGVRVVRLVSYYEEDGYYQPQAYKVMSDGMNESIEFQGASMPVGENNTKVKVNITYIIE